MYYNNNNCKYDFGVIAESVQLQDSEILAGSYVNVSEISGSRVGISFKSYYLSTYSKRVQEPG